MKRGDSKTKLLGTTADLLHRQGFAATGLNQIVDQSGAPKGSLYFHFPGGKEQLVAEALELSSASLTELLATVLSAAPTPAAALDAIIAYFAQQLESSQFAKGCPIATVALEQAATSDALHAVCAATYRRWEGLIAERLARDGLPPAHAALLLSAIEGALLLCRAHRSTEPLRTVGAQLRPLLERTTP